MGCTAVGAQETHRPVARIYNNLTWSLLDATQPIQCGMSGLFLVLFYILKQISICFSCFRDAATLFRSEAPEMFFVLWKEKSHLTFHWHGGELTMNTFDFFRLNLSFKWNFVLIIIILLRLKARPLSCIGQAKQEVVLALAWLPSSDITLFSIYINWLINQLHGNQLISHIQYYSYRRSAWPICICHSY